MPRNWRVHTNPVYTTFANIPAINLFGNICCDFWYEFWHIVRNFWGRFACKTKNEVIYSQVHKLSYVFLNLAWFTFEPAGSFTWALTNHVEPICTICQIYCRGSSIVRFSIVVQAFYSFPEQFCWVEREFGICSDRIPTISAALRKAGLLSPPTQIGGWGVWTGLGKKLILEKFA